MYRFRTAVLAATFLLAGSALAASGPKTSNRTLNLTGTGTLDPADADTNGACKPAAVSSESISWLDQCSDTNCVCIQVAVAKPAGSMDKGKQTVSNFFITLDPDVNPATEPALPIGGGTGPIPACGLFRGVVTDTAGTEVKTLNLIGINCKKVIGTSSSNPTGTHVGDTLSGGWGISNDPVLNPLASGWGSLSGSTGKEVSGSLPVTIKLSGLVSE